ncbi:hypothetical protein H8356DRAFT_1436561 [Neocallimastix lanati (nom. inval.)]|nr:hypothetical protein H8356DRAFT_1436561 [Neocallimastix sp. JGI-2020a]
MRTQKKKKKDIPPQYQDALLHYSFKFYPLKEEEESHNNLPIYLSSQESPRFKASQASTYMSDSNTQPSALEADALPVFSDSNKLTLFITKVFGYRPGNNSSAFNVSTHEGAGTFQALANKELTSPKANWASGL